MLPVGRHLLHMVRIKMQSDTEVYTLSRKFELLIDNRNIGRCLVVTGLTRLFSNYYLCQGGYVFARLCLFVCLFVYVSAR